MSASSWDEHSRDARGRSETHSRTSALTHLFVALMVANERTTDRAPVPTHLFAPHTSSRSKRLAPRASPPAKCTEGRVLPPAAHRGGAYVRSASARRGARQIGKRYFARRLTFPDVTWGSGASASPPRHGVAPRPPGAVPDATDRWNGECLSEPRFAGSHRGPSPRHEHLHAAHRAAPRAPRPAGHLAQRGRKGYDEPPNEP